MSSLLHAFACLACLLGPGEQPFALRRLDLAVTIDYQREALSGSATLALRNATDHPVSEVPLLLNRLMTVTGVTAATGAAVPFTQQVVVFGDDPLRQVNAITVTPPVAVAPGDSLVLTVPYAGYLAGYTETGSLYIKDHVDRDFTILRVDAYAFPSLGVPSWHANFAGPDEPFAFAAQVTVPAGLVVAMGGEPVAHTTRDSLVTWRYRSTIPVPFLNITIAPYRLVERDGIRVFAFSADSAGALQVLEAIGRAVDRYTAWYGSPGPRPRLTVMEIPEGYGSQASLGAGILQTADAFRQRTELRQLYHELSHVWNVPDLDRPSPRWNEGLASFLEWRMAATLDGWNDWGSQLDRSLARIRRACSAPVRCDSVPMAGYGQAGMTDLSYSVGNVMFYILHQVMGSDAFDRAYRDFFQRYRATGARTADLVVAFHRADPASDAILRDWLLTSRWYGPVSGGSSVDDLIRRYPH